MILLNSTIKSKQEVKTASNEKVMKQHQRFSTIFIQVGEALPLPHPQCPVEGCLTAPHSSSTASSVCVKLAHSVGSCYKGSIDGLVHKVKARGANNTPNGTQASRRILWHLYQPVWESVPVSPGPICPSGVCTALPHKSLFSICPLPGTNRCKVMAQTPLVLIQTEWLS